MGPLYTTLEKTIYPQVPVKILLLGLDAAGKTTMIYQLKLGTPQTIPNLGLALEECKNEELELFCWELGGSDRIRPLYRHYSQGTNGLIWMVDSLDEERFEDSR
mmetsp:Transcript_1821/g.1744  ORF Transcript_1821/g.1744 Transcript_1821/m.1744 type:complete len:104 (-) Transcript_1821:74-385(-)